AARLRTYWDTYGKFPFDERMMKILTDPKSGGAATREAAENIATLGSRRTIGTTVWSGGWLFGPPRPNPAIAKFSNPTAADAILTAMDRDLKAVAAADEEAGWKERRAGEAERDYLDALVALGDKRIAPTLAKRAG